MKAFGYIFLLIFAVHNSAQAQQVHSYAGMQSRKIKTLSDQQITELETGKGMVLALAAELNGYPGPSHVLDAADQLGLTSKQRVDIQNLFSAMKGESIPLGKILLIKEAELNEQFSRREITPETLRAASAEIAKTQGELREAHLRYHIYTAALLSAEQLRRYQEIRGYLEKPKSDHRN